MNAQTISNILEKQNIFLNAHLKKINYKKWATKDYLKIIKTIEFYKDKINFSNIDNLQDIFKVGEFEDLNIKFVKKFDLSEMNHNKILFNESMAFEMSAPLKELFSTYEGEQILFFVVSLMKHIRIMKNRSEKIQEYQFLLENCNHYFQTLNFPLIIMDSTGDVIFYNTEFSDSKILPKECLNLKNGQNFQKNYFYEVVSNSISTINHDIIFFAFKKNSLHQNNPNISLGASQLGIVASSIAHEINNPLAGILASLSVIEMNSDLEESQKEQCKDIELSAKRCKELINIFLGFSRVDINKIQAKLSVNDAYSESLNLIRFRLIETHIRLDITLEEIDNDNFNNEYNSSVMAMIFYLIFNELITQLGYTLLVAQTKRETSVIRGKFLLKPKELVLKLHNKNLLDWEIGQLLQGLLSSQNLEFKKALSE